MCNYLPKLVPTARGDDAFGCDYLRTPGADNADDWFRNVHDLDDAPILDQATLGGATRLQESASRCPRTPAPPDSMSQSEQGKQRQSQQQRSGRFAVVMRLVTEKRGQGDRQDQQ